MSDTADAAVPGDAPPDEDAGDATEAQHHESVRRRLAQQWAEIRRIERERHPEPPPIVAGPSNFSRAEVPYGVDLAAAWSWRLLVIAGAAVVLGYLVSFFSVLMLPLAIALLLAALVAPLVDWLTRIGVRRSAAAALSVVATLGAVVALLSFAGNQVADGAADLADSVNRGPRRDHRLAQERPAQRERLTDRPTTSNGCRRRSPSRPARAAW